MRTVFVLFALAIGTVGAQNVSIAAQMSHPVCYQINDLWWDTRLALKLQQANTALDVICSKFDHQTTACNLRSSRANDPNLTPEERNAPCTMVGAHSRKCVGNPCNHFNQGECTVQDTQGICVWIEKDMVPVMNKYYAQRGWDPIPGWGCYRNPCNIPGWGKAIDDCPKRSIPGLFECTWCKGSGDAILVGKGMGCQASNLLTSKATCAYVNSKGVARGSIIQSVQNSRCQCSVDFPMCNQVFTSSRSAYKFRYPSGR